MDNLKLLEDFDTKIYTIYIQEDLFPLRGKEDSYKLPNTKQILSWHREVTRHRNCHFKPNYYDYQSNINDLLFISDEIVYFTAHLYLYKPFINTPLKDAYWSGKYWIFPVFQNGPGKRYEMYINICYEKLYNYWDRIGDLIASYFPTKFSRNIYFSKVIQQLKYDYSNNSDFDWLLNFSENQYKEFNTERIKTVHKISINTENRSKQMKNLTDELKSRELTNQILNYPNFFKEMNGLCIEGFQRTLSFLEHVNAVENYRCVHNQFE